MIVRQFLLWARSAPPDQRAEAVGGLAQAYLDGELSLEDRREAKMALTAMLDDPSRLVRHAMADILADSPEAPRHVIIALANDHPEIASVVLGRSPVLMDADLIDCAAIGDEPIQTAIGRRPYVSIATSAALAEIAGAGALAALVSNPGAEISECSLWRMVERHGRDPVLCHALSHRPGLQLDMRHAVAVVVSEGLSAHVSDCGWLGSGRAERIFREARDKATVALAATATPGELDRFVAYLRRSGQLTPALILRALLSHGTTFVQAALADLAGLPPARVAALLYDRRGAGFSALYDQAGLPKGLKAAFEAAISALRETGRTEALAGHAQLSQKMVERVLSACDGHPAAGAGNLMALLRRFEAEAAREAARTIDGAFADEAALTLTHQPAALIELDREHLRDAA